MKEPTIDRRAPRYSPHSSDPYRDHLRRRRSEDPALPVTHLLREIRELGYSGSANLLGRYLTQGSAEGDELTYWITTVRAVDLPHLHSCTNGLELDRAAVDARLTHPYSTATPRASTPEPNGS